MGRGSSGASGGNGWKSQLRQFAQKGEVPSYIGGSRENQSKVFKEIDKLYSMPDTNARISDQGDAVLVQMNGTVRRSGYPSGESASEEEKRGVLKWILYGMSRRR